MLFSVVVPVKNAQKELPDCILSILRQAFRDFELILVYTESKDDSFDCCRAFANVDGRIRLIKTEEKTAYGAKRVGVEEAKGEYVTVLFPDGRVEETFLSEVKRALAKRKVDMVAYPKAREYTTTKAAPFFYAENKDDYRGLLLDENGINQHFVGFFAKKELYQEAFSYFHEGIEADEDDLIIFACFARAKGVTFCAESLYSYGRKVYFPRPHGLARICSEEVLFQRLHVVIVDTDCSFVAKNVALHAFLVTDRELERIAKEDKEDFFEAFTRVIHSAYYYALKDIDMEKMSKKQQKVLRWLLFGQKRRAYFFLSRRR